MRNLSTPRQQRGVVLAVSLILLLLLTILAITASTSSTLQERMAANAQDENIAFQASESALTTVNSQLNTYIEPAADSLITNTSYTNKSVRTRLEVESHPTESSLNVDPGTPDFILYDITSTTTLDPSVVTIDENNAYARHRQGYRLRIIK
ncbi:PilX N-terminal domain-containing pilus assembly protein [Pseudomonas sp. J452]|uniref:pilus assembly PilX family protein n=1 Tax=Pseudomonas sp. J452 TaxID=2898441 RepID=UPI0021ADB0DD|nr:PilX N-terminal domain-containing pilus assembly protein [Pseudomonas sp. J452]UUY10141.1 PilX N-terminal domain-containing pilus assembly protein [Pseudomonas sp. J452]